MKADYRNELDKSYLILDEIEEAPEFIMGMLSENEIQGLLIASKRSFNGSGRMYYEISGMQTLETLAKTRLLTERDLKTFFQDLLLTLEELNSYFLNPSGILLDFAHIYVGQEGCRFCYYPVLGDTIEKKMAAFGEEMLGYIDHNNEKAVVLAYQFYRLVKEGNRMAKQILHEMLDTPKQEEIEESKSTEENDDMQAEDFWGEETGQEVPEQTIGMAAVIKEDVLSILIFAMLFFVCLGYFGYEFYKAGIWSTQMIFGDKNGMIMFAFLLLSIIGEAVCLYLNYRRLLNHSKKRE